MKKKVVVITGPTAVGKSSIAVKIAKLYNGEIISADSSQVYKGFNIGSGKITKKQMQGVTHHLLDILNFEQDFNVALFKKLAEEKITEIFKKNKNVIICGGTGLYIKALVCGYEFFNVKRNQSLRQNLEDIAAKQGLDKLFEILKDLNPEKAKSIDKLNKVRLIRAIEIEKDTSKKMSISKPKFSYQIFVLNSNRELLYEKINNRVEQMLKDGLLEEVENLIKKGANLTHNSFKSLGYKEFYDYLTNNSSNLNQSVENLKKATRNYAKRQITFFKQFKNAIWINAEDHSKATSEIIKNIEQN